MSLVGKKAPSFKASAVINGKEIVENFSLDQYLRIKVCIILLLSERFYFRLPH
jgi:peroxiredoxin 2/4